MTDYRPIDCDQHSILERLAVRRPPVRLNYLDADGRSQSAEGAVVDVLTRSGAEYLVLETEAASLSVRLDRVQAVSVGPDRVFSAERRSEAP